MKYNSQKCGCCWSVLNYFWCLLPTHIKTFFLPTHIKTFIRNNSNISMTLHVFLHQGFHFFLAVYIPSRATQFKAWCMTVKWLTPLFQICLSRSISKLQKCQTGMTDRSNLAHAKSIIPWPMVWSTGQICPIPWAAIWEGLFYYTCMSTHWKIFHLNYSHVNWHTWCMEILVQYDPVRLQYSICNK